MTYFTMGYWVLALAAIISLAGAMVGLACVRQSQMSVTARFRTVWLSAAAVSIGGVGTWLAIYVTMLGVGASQGELRYNVTRIVMAAVLTVLAVLAGLLVSGRNTTLPRLGLGGLIMGVGLGASHYLGMGAINAQGAVSLNLMTAIGATVIAIVVSPATLWAAARVHATLAQAGMALLFAIAITGLHYLGLAGVTVHFDPLVAPPSGKDLFTLFVPVFVLGTLSLAIPITAVLVAPDRTGRAPGARTNADSDDRSPQPIG